MIENTNILDDEGKLPRLKLYKGQPILYSV